jgi:hypothetical protein
VIKNNFKLSVLFGFISTLLVWTIFQIFIGNRAGWSASPMGLLYNIPVSFAFFVLCWDILQSFRHVGFLDGLRNNMPYLVVWTVGLSVLYIRLFAETVNISGHLTWLMVMPVHAYLRKLPTGFILLILLITIKSAYFNFILFNSSESGIYGVCAGLCLSCILVVLNYLIKKKVVGKAEKGSVRFNDSLNLRICGPRQVIFLGQFEWVMWGPVPNVTNLSTVGNEAVNSRQKTKALRAIRYNGNRMQ